MIQINHHHGLDEVTIYCISHPCAACFNFDPVAPRRMKTIDFILTGRATVLIERLSGYWPGLFEIVHMEEQGAICITSVLNCTLSLIFDS